MIDDVVKKYLENSHTFKQKKILFKNKKYISFYHGRELCFKTNDSWLSIKGTGWNYGPPKAYTIKNDFNCLGLLNYENAKREKKISNILNRKYSKKFSNFLELIKFNRKDIDKIKNFLPKAFVPSLILREVSSPYRLNDLYLKNKKKAFNSFKYYFGSNKKIAISKLQMKVLNTIINYHLKGYLHDMLDLGNINTHGQILDLEYFYIPNIKYPKYFKVSKKVLNNRKEKEAIYFLEIIYQISETLNEKTTLRKLANKSLEMLETHDKYKHLIFYKTLKKLTVNF